MNDFIVDRKNHYMWHFDCVIWIIADNVLNLEATLERSVLYNWKLFYSDSFKLLSNNLIIWTRLVAFSLLYVLSIKLYQSTDEDFIIFVSGIWNWLIISEIVNKFQFMTINCIYLICTFRYIIAEYIDISNSFLDIPIACGGEIHVSSSAHTQSG